MKKNQLRQVILYVQNDMNPKERAKFEEKMNGDPGLNDLVKQVRSILEDLEDTELLKIRMNIDRIMKPDLPATKGKLRPFKGMQHFWMAAILVVLIGFSVVIYMSISAYFRFHDEENSPGRFNIFRKDLYYITPVYGEMLRYETRSDRFRLLEPADSAIFSVRDDVIFQWESEITGPLYLEIMNRHGKILYAPREPVTSPYLVLQRQSRGAYIYRFRTESSAIHYGVIFIK